MSHEQYSGTKKACRSNMQDRKNGRTRALLPSLPPLSTFTHFKTDKRTVRTRFYLLNST